MLRILVVEPDGVPKVRKVENGIASLKEILGEYKSERFPVGNYTILRSTKYRVSDNTMEGLLRSGEIFIIIKVDTDGDGDVGAYTSLSEEDITIIKETIKSAKPS